MAEGTTRAATRRKPRPGRRDAGDGPVFQRGDGRWVAVAEGVEDGPTLTLLAGLGCDLAQGYFISRPMLANDVVLTPMLLASPHLSVVI